MLARICCALLLLACIPAWCQEDASKVEIGSPSDQDALMLVPPPVSGLAYHRLSRRKRNQLPQRWGFLHHRMVEQRCLVDDARKRFQLLGVADHRDGQNHRAHASVAGLRSGVYCLPERDFAQPGQSEPVVESRLSVQPEHVTRTCRRDFTKFSNVFDQPNAFSDPVTGALPLPKSAVIVPVADQIENGTTAQLTYQTSANGMLGGGGSFGTLYYPNPSQVAGLYDSRTIGSSFFYSQRISDRYYVGGTYQYQESCHRSAANLSLPSQTQTQTRPSSASYRFI